MDQPYARLSGGTITVSTEAIVEVARRKNFDLELSISPDGLKARFTAPVGPLHVPVELCVQKLSAAEAIVACEGLSVEASVLPVPLSMLQSQTRKFPFLALDAEHKRLFINIQNIASKWAGVTIKDARLSDERIEIDIDELILNDLPNI